MTVDPVAFNPAKGDTKAPNRQFVITSYSNNIFGCPGLFPLEYDTKFHFTWHAGATQLLPYQVVWIELEEGF